MSKKGKGKVALAATNAWQDREIRFDAQVHLLQPRKGEFQIDSINAVEDTKGNNGEKGMLSVSNLRIIWCAHNDPRTNLSIGFNCILHISIKSASSRLRGNTQALYVMTKYNGSRFEFVFTSLVRDSPRLFTTVQAVNRAYVSTRLYRDLALRSAIIKDGNLLLLPDETVFDRVGGVWNLSSDQGSLGSFILTNVRMVWHANLAQNFNVSVPYLQMTRVSVRDSKFGRALVVETTQRCGGYILGFRIDPKEKLKELHEELSRLLAVYSEEPIFGVKFEVTAKQAPPSASRVEQKEDGVEIVEDGSFDAIAAYYADADKTADREPVYSAELGLAVEKLPSGLSLEQLWEVPTGL